MVGLVDQYLARFRPERALLQKVLFRKLSALHHLGQFEQAKEVAEKVVALDPASAHGRFGQRMLEKLKNQ